MTISIIVPIYNVEKYLHRCINSIIKQTYKELEIILVDDGSTDRSGEICDYYSRIDERIKVIHKANGGLSDARNKGIELARGSYLGFVDGDDYIEPNMYYELFNGLNDISADIACCGRFIDTDRDHTIIMSLNNRRIFDSRNAIKELLIGNIINESAWDKLYKKNLFNNIRYPYGEINEDIVTTPFLFKEAKTIVHVGKPLYHYYMRVGSITNSGYSEKQGVIYEHIIKLKKFIGENYPDLKGYFYNYEYTVLIGAIGSIRSGDKRKFSLDYEKFMGLFNRDLRRMLGSKEVMPYIKLKSLLVKTNIYNICKYIIKK